MHLWSWSILLPFNKVKNSYKWSTGIRAWKSSVVHLWLRPGWHFTAPPIKNPRPRLLLFTALTRHANNSACGPLDVFSPGVWIPEQLMGASQPLLTITRGHFSYLLTCFTLRMASWCRKALAKKESKTLPTVQCWDGWKETHWRGKCILGWMEEGKQIKLIKPKIKEKLSYGEDSIPQTLPRSVTLRLPTEQTCAPVSRKKQQSPVPPASV